VNDRNDPGRVVLVSADGHVSGNHEQYRSYLESPSLAYYAPSPIARRVVPTSNEQSEPYHGIPDGIRSPVFTRV
jgi:hypothetical protein